MIDPVVLVAGVGLLLLGLLLIRVGRALGVALLILGLVAILGLMVVALLHQSRAAETAAAAAVVATTGQTMNSTVVTVLAVLLVIVLLASGTVILYLLYRLRRAERRGRWLPGPNARWGRVETPLVPPYPWWMVPPPPWWGYPPARTEGPAVYVIDEGDEEPDPMALPWEEWGW